MWMAALYLRPAAFSLALVLCFAALPAVAKGACGSPEEVRAAQLRQFHYQLQVVALNCRGDDPSLPGKWGAYIHHHGGTMSVNANVMRGYFTRIGKGVAGFDRYNTVLTNRESIRVHETDGYCEMHAPLFDRATRANPQQLVTLAAETVGTPTDIALCTESAKAEPDKKQKRIASKAE
jgi:hypothetical protein